MTTTAEIRSKFLDFFKSKGHEVVPSSSLIPGNDPTLLFTNAGMVQFKDCFLGRDQRSYVTAATSQRCVRAGGKHNDLENVGYTARHHTFFEMLGNFSFGDYFKREAIFYAWEFLTRVVGLPKERLWVTVFEEDDEAANIWIKEIGVDPNRLSRIGAKDNFWSMGDTGPCGPCTEIFYDHGPEIWGGPPGTPEEDGDRYIEIWNLVFMQFDRSKDGTLTPLPKPSVDTGMGLERLAAILQNGHSNYDIDLFQSLIKDAAKLTGCDDLTNSSLKVIADHIRSCSFLIVDGVLPSNEGRGYVLRRIIRRALRHGHKLGQPDPFFFKLVKTLVKEMGAAYPELKDKQASVEKILKLEEERFAETLSHGMKLLESELPLEIRFSRYAEKQSHGKSLFQSAVPGSGTAKIVFRSRTNSGDVIDQQFEMRSIPSNCNDVDEFIKNELHQLGDHDYDVESELHVVFVAPQEIVRKSNPEKYLSILNNLSTIKILSDADILIVGDVVFRLYDTFGFPVDLTADVAREYGLRIDYAGYTACMEEQKNRARASSHFGIDYHDAITTDAVTAFTGYDHVLDRSKVLALFKDNQSVNEINAGDEAVVILAQTPFYAESGGQAGDTGVLLSEAARFEVMDTRKQGSAFIHIGQLNEGSIKVGDEIEAMIDANRRSATVRNHSATHLMHAALRATLGEHVQQKGSLVNNERLRFDFSHFEAIKPEQLQQIEQQVNEQIRHNLQAQAEEMPIDQAKTKGAMALFGEKYGNVVRVVSMGDYSIELCGGTHVKRTGDIGFFKIVSESGIAAGVRRIEAVTGAGAVDWAEQTETQISRLAGMMKSGRDDIETKLQQLLEKVKVQDKELSQLKTRLATQTGRDLTADAVEINGIKVLATQLDGVDSKALRDTLDKLKDKLGSSAIVLASVEGDKVTLVAGVSKDQTSRIKAGDLVNMVAQQVGGKGGGRPDMAMAGGTQPENLAGALASVSEWVKTQIQ